MYVVFFYEDVNVCECLGALWLNLDANSRRIEYVLSTSVVGPLNRSSVQHSKRLRIK